MNKINRKPAPFEGLPHRAIFGLAGWSGSGKTTLAEQLIAELAGRGLTVATIKHAHHDFEADIEGKDSWRHRKAGARQVLVSSARRSALFTERAPSETEPQLAALLAALEPADLVLVEGFKRDPLPKLEIWRACVGKPPLWQQDDWIVALATDSPPENLALPVFALSDAAGMADFICGFCQLETAR